jgi:hypothetical protein
MAERGQVDIDHHRIDHRPDQDGDHQVHRCDLETRQRHEDTRHSHAQAHPSHDAHRHPDRQPLLEKADAASHGRARRRILLGNSHPNLPVSNCLYR